MYGCASLGVVLRAFATSLKNQSTDGLPNEVRRSGRNPGLATIYDNFQG